MPAIGAASRAHIRKIYTISAAMAGIAGALIAQTTETVSLEALSFERSADVLVMLVLGGAGRLYGGIVGAAVFMIARDQFSGIAPQYWFFWIGLLLITVVMFLPNGILGGLSKLIPKLYPTKIREVFSFGYQKIFQSVFSFVFSLAVALIAIGGWLQHLYVCFNDDRWGFLIAGAIFLPIGVVHGWGVWLGLW
jgi:hypothetical protein